MGLMFAGAIIFLLGMFAGAFLLLFISASRLDNEEL